MSAQPVDIIFLTVLFLWLAVAIYAGVRLVIAWPRRAGLDVAIRQVARIAAILVSFYMPARILAGYLEQLAGR
jgi:hypothetical protein